MTGVLIPFPSQYLAKIRQLKIGVSAVSKTTEMTNKRIRMFPICSQFTFRPATLSPPLFDACSEGLLRSPKPDRSFVHTILHTVVQRSASFKGFASQYGSHTVRVWRGT